MFEHIAVPSLTQGLTVEVPCSTSNLGPGFDLAGLALSLHLRVEVRRAPSGHGLCLSLGKGTRAWPSGPDNLLLRGFQRAWLEGGGAQADFALAVESDIPVSRGLGSSAAALVAGLLLGATWAPKPLTRAQLLGWALALEGHPDNVSPALLGGCVLSVPRASGAPCVVRQELHPSLAFAVAWPATPLATSFARSLLPAQVPLADAVENPRRLALLLEGLRSGDPELLELGSHDCLHVPYRLPHIPGGAPALAAARDAGAWIATISGSGSALFAVAAHARIEAVAGAMHAALERAAAPAVAHVVSAAMQAPSPRCVP